MKIFDNKNMKKVKEHKINNEEYKTKSRLDPKIISYNL